MVIRTLRFNSRVAQKPLSRSIVSQTVRVTPFDLNSRIVSTRGSRRFSSAVKKNDRLLVIGSGVAGSATALIAAQIYKIPVTMLFAGEVPHDCNSNWAQGGIIYRNYDPASGDSADLLAEDIHKAGAGLCVDAAVRKVAEEGPDRVRQLLLAGGPFADVPFDKKQDGKLSLCLGELP